MWDHEVDLISIGAGIGGLAGAIATVDAGGDVLVAGAPTVRPYGETAVATRHRVHSLRGWLPTAIADPDTRDFFAGFAEWVPESAFVARDVPVPVRVATPIAGGQPEPFLGSRLADWAATCLTSPYGMLYSNVFGWGRTTMRAADGGTIEVAPLGTMTCRQGVGAAALREWMADEARDRGIDVLDDTPLSRLVFEAGRVTGAVFTTPDGEFAVRARRGVTMAPDDQDWITPACAEGPADGESRRVCLVGRTAGRFGRVELLAAERPSRAEDIRTACPATRRSLLVGLHDARQARSALGRCGKVD